MVRRVSIMLLVILYACTDDKIDLSHTVTVDCVLPQPVADIPDDLYQVGEIIQSAEYPPFTKQLSVYGITLIARDDISDVFMQNVANTITDMFPRSGTIDTILQKQVLRNIHQYNTVIPLFYGEDWGLSPAEEDLWDQTASENSICDIIMENVPNQVMEVVEHILHHVTDVGLHYTFPEEWGLSNSSTLYNVTQEAVDENYYDIQQYSDIDDVGVRMRVILQEYAYWIIYTAWDLREIYGPQDSEWFIMNSSELKEKLPDSYELFNKTVMKIMACPSDSILSTFNN
ncbi:MAG TPA: hypothetical protein EYO07_08515 [Candidatus Marinimicrobia bacterium]|nr:hypothetical protein [Candidatus Neomarinimicrobiota bacterium]